MPPDKIPTRVESADDDTPAKDRESFTSRGGSSTASTVGRGAHRVAHWFEETFSNSRCAAIGAVVGFVVAILLLTIGLFKTLIIVLLVACGVAIGQYIDGDAKLVRAVKSLLKKR